MYKIAHTLENNDLKKIYVFYGEKGADLDHLFETDTTNSLPPVFSAIDKDISHSVGADGRLTFLVSSMSNSTFCAAALKDIDVHIMNKQSIIRNASALLELI